MNKIFTVILAFQSAHMDTDFIDAYALAENQTSAKEKAIEHYRKSFKMHAVRAGAYPALIQDETKYSQIIK